MQQHHEEIDEVQIIDDFTFKIILITDYPMFPRDFVLGKPFYTPSHYIKLFHPKYNSMSSIENQLAALGFASVQECISWFVYEGFLDNKVPSLRPWIAMNDFAASDFVLIRNPFYFKVDSSGNQLPYIDKAVFIFSENSEIVMLKLLAGELDYQTEHINSDDYESIAAHASAANYQVLHYVDDVGGLKLAIARNTMGNVPIFLRYSNTLKSPNNAYPFQFFIEP